MRRISQRVSGGLQWAGSRATEDGSKPRRFSMPIQIPPFSSWSSQQSECEKMKAASDARKSRCKNGDLVRHQSIDLTQLQMDYLTRKNRESEKTLHGWLAKRMAQSHEHEEWMMSAEEGGAPQNKLKKHRRSVNSYLIEDFSVEQLKRVVLPFGTARSRCSQLISTARHRCSQPVSQRVFHNFTTAHRQLLHITRRSGKRVRSSDESAWDRSDESA